MKVIMWLRFLMEFRRRKCIFFRKYTKGRDFYDLVWYLGKKVAPNIELLNNAVIQTEKKDMKLTEDNYRGFLAKRVKEADFTAARKDVERFLAEIPKRPQRDQAVRGAGLAISRRAVQARPNGGSGGTIPPNPVG